MIKLKVLFWNTYKKPLDEEISMLAKESDSNLIILFENTSIDDDLINSLLKYTGKKFIRIENKIFKKGKIYTSIENSNISEKYAHGRYGLYKFELDDYPDLLLGVVHLPSKRNWGDPSDHFGFCVELKSDVQTAEAKLGIDSTILIGDFNMNPFENGMINSSALHNTSSREIALTKNREFQSRTYKYFYNPMWNFFGEHSKGKAQGTHYYNTYSPNNYHWNIYDQILLRPELIESFDEENLEIVTKIGGLNLTKKINGITRVDKNISDHLPIKFELTLLKQNINEKSMA